VIGGLDDGRVVALPLDAPLVVGADASAGLVVRGPGVERRHVVVRLDGAALEVVDLASKAGVRVGRDTVRRARLEPNAELFVGSVRLQYLR
jgi:pSer/pThr/pTyr-binding forkhead associated (FHA) protein